MCILFSQDQNLIRTVFLSEVFIFYIWVIGTRQHTQKIKINYEFVYIQTWVNKCGRPLNSLVLLLQSRPTLLLRWRYITSKYWEAKPNRHTCLININSNIISLRNIDIPWVWFLSKLYNYTIFILFCPAVQINCIKSIKRDKHKYNCVIPARNYISIKQIYFLYNQGHAL